MATKTVVIAGATYSDVPGVEVSDGVNENLAVFTDDATASASDIASGKTAYVDGQLITGSMADCTVTQTFNWQNVTNKNQTITNATDGYLVVLGTRNGTGKFYTYAKNVSNVSTITLLSDLTQVYGSSAKCGGSVYRFVCSAGATVNIWGTNTKSSTDANQNGAFLTFVLSK